MNTLNGYSKSTLTDTYVLTAAGGHLAVGNAANNIPLNNSTVNTNLNADTVDSWHRDYFQIGYDGGRHYRVQFALGAEDLNWKTVVKVNSSYTAAPTSNAWQAATVRGHIWYSTNNHSGGELRKYPFCAVFKYVAGTSLLNTASLYLPQFAKDYDCIRIVRISTNSFELQLKQIASWQVGWVEYQISGGGTKNAYTSLQTAGSGTVVVSAADSTTLTEDKASYAYTSGTATNATNITVTQHTSNSTEYPLVWSNETNTSTKTSNQLYKSYSDLTYNPANKRITVTQLRSPGVLTLDGVSGVYLKYNNTNASSLVLGSNYFKPFDSAKDLIDLGTSAARWKGVYANTGDFSSTVSALAFYGAIGDASMTVKPERNNEVNFGGTNNSATIYFGYRATDSKPIPTKFVFGGSTGTAEITANTGYFRSTLTSYSTVNAHRFNLKYSGTTGVYADLQINTRGTKCSTEGTAGTTGVAYLFLGNSTAVSSTLDAGAENALGILRIYGSNTGYTDIRCGTHNTSKYTLYLPGANGQFVVHTNDTAIGGAAIPVYIAASGAATACTIAAGSGDTNRPLMVTNGSNGMYYTSTITGNYTTGSLISTVTNTTSVAHTCTNSNGSVSLYAASNRGLYDSTNSAWIIYLTKAADHVYVPKWANKGSATQPVYFNGSGEPIVCTSYTDALDSRYVKKAGDTMTGTLNMSTRAAIYLWDDSATASHRLTLRCASDISRIYNYTGSAYGAMYIGHDGTSAIVVTSGQAVGIGTGSPSGKLHVNGGLLNITANSGTLTIGCQNTSFTHYSTTGGTHWFNKAVEVNGNHSPHANNSFTSGTSGRRWSNVYSVLGDFTGIVTMSSRLRMAGTTATPAWDSAGAITWSENTSDSQPVSLVYTSYDSYRSPAGLVLLGSQGNEWFEVKGNIYGNGFVKSGSSDSYALLGGGGHKAIGNASGNIALSNGTLCTNLNADKLDGWNRYQIQGTPVSNFMLIYDTTPALFEGRLLASSGCSIVNAPDNNAPFGKVWYCTSNIAWYPGETMYFTPGETICVESWIMRPSGATGTAGVYYLGIRFKDKQGKAVNSNAGTIYMTDHSGWTCPADGTWYRRYAEYTIPKSHTAYNGSDGGGYYSGDIRLLINYSSGTIPTYYGGFRIYRKYTAPNADTIDGYHISVGSSAGTNTSTIYFVI